MLAHNYFGRSHSIAKCKNAVSLYLQKQTFGCELAVSGICASERHVMFSRRLCETLKGAHSLFDVVTFCICASTQVLRLRPDSLFPVRSGTSRTFNPLQ